MAIDDDDQWLTISEAAALTRLSRPALAQLRYKGGGPVYYRLSGKTILYRRSQLEAWMNDCAYDRTGHPLVSH
jgi:excisionase family DNA binding protein